MKQIYTFKEKYDEQELEELCQWFEERMDRLPETLQLSDSTESENLPKTVRAYVRRLRESRRSVVFNGYVAHLFLIRERLRETGLE